MVRPGAFGCGFVNAQLQALHAGGPAVLQKGKNTPLGWWLSPVLYMPIPYSAQAESTG